MIIMYIAFIEFLCYNRSRGELQKHTFAAILLVNNSNKYN